jgi:hypothetical protein
MPPLVVAKDRLFSHNSESKIHEAQIAAGTAPGKVQVWLLASGSARGQGENATSMDHTRKGYRWSMWFVVGSVEQIDLEKDKRKLAVQTA